MGLLGAPESLLGASWSVLGASWSVLEDLGGVLERLGRVLGRLGAENSVLKPLRSQARLYAVQVPSSAWPPGADNI